MAKDSFYFAHDYGSRNDPKLINLQIKHGMQGIGLYWCIVEMLYEQGGYFKYNVNELKFILRTDYKKIESVINDFGLFKIEDGNIYSDSVLKRLKIREDKTYKAKESASKKWGSDSDNTQKRAERLTNARLIGQHTKEEWSEMLLYFNNTCVKCNSKEFIVKDHITPIYQGGSDHISNLQPICRTCNSSKGSENVDYRSQYCIKNACEMPAKYIKNACEMPAKYIETPAIKERKGKERKGNEIKEKERRINTPPQTLNNPILTANNSMLGFQETWSEFMNSHQWHEKLCMDYHLEMGFLITDMENFLKKLNSQSQFPRKLSDTKAYYFNCLQKALKAESEKKAAVKTKQFFYEDCPTLD